MKWFGFEAGGAAPPKSTGGVTTTTSSTPIIKTTPPTTTVNTHQLAWRRTGVSPSVSCGVFFVHLNSLSPPEQYGGQGWEVQYLVCIVNLY
jgi:hypothetical protein